MKIKHIWELSDIVGGLKITGGEDCIIAYRYGGTSTLYSLVSLRDGHSLLTDNNKAEIVEHLNANWYKPTVKSRAL